MKWLMTEGYLENIFFFLGMCLDRLVCFSASCRVSLGRPFIPYCNIFEHINSRNWINWNNVCLPLNCWRGRRYCIIVNIHLRFSRYLRDYIFLKENISSCLNLSLTRDVNLECLWRFIVSFLSKGYSLDFFSLGTWKYIGHPNILKCSISSFTPVKASSGVMFFKVWWRLLFWTYIVSCMLLPIES